MMKMPLIRLILLCVPALLPGQEAKPEILPYPGPVVPAFTELKTFLTLTDAQVQTLQNVMNSRNEASSAIYRQISEKYGQLYTLMNSDSATALQLGQLMVDIRNLQKQLPSVDGPFKTQARNVLTADQRNKLATLLQAIQLQTTAYQAVSLLLIDGPEYRTLEAGLPAVMPGFCGLPNGITGTGVASIGAATGIVMRTRPEGIR
jgi:hypothetical protein